MTILELREKRAKAWEATKAFLDSHRNDKGMLSAEDDATYSRMEQEITDLGKEIARLERQEALDAELNRPVNKPLTGKPMNGKETAKTGRATDEYRQNFWNMMRSKTPMPTVMNALQIGTDSEGGYLVPDEYERTLVELWRRRTSSASWQRSSRPPAATARSPWWLPRVPRPGSMRRAHIWRATTPSVRCLSALTSWVP